MNLGQYYASMGGVPEVMSKHAFGFDRKHLTKVVPVRRDDGRPAGAQREHRDGRVDGVAYARPVTVALRDHDPATNAHILRRFCLDGPRYEGLVRSVPFSREVIQHLEAITGKRYGGEQRCPR